MSKLFFERMDKIDALLMADPEQCDFQRDLAPLLKENAAHRYLYEQIPNAEWLSVLYEQFNIPDYDKAKLLERLAADAPEQVASIILKMSEASDRHAQRCLVSAICAMPPCTSAGLVGKVIGWIELTMNLMFEDECAKLIIHLAEGNQSEAAFKLADSLLAVFPGPGQNADFRQQFQEPVSRMDDWDYKKVLDTILPVLIKTGGMRTLEFLVSLLQQAAEYSMSTDADGQPREPYYMWPRAVENHEQNSHCIHVKDHLLFAVREAGEALIDNYKSEVLATVERLKEYSIFVRIGLYLRGRYTKLDPLGTEALLCTPDIYRNHAYYHELFHLLRAVFGDLSEEAQNVYFDYVRESDLDGFIESFTRWRGNPPTDEEKLQAERRYKFRKLIPVKDHLTGEWKNEYDELSSEFQEYPYPDFLSYISSVDFKEGEPLLVSEELKMMTAEEFTKYLHDSLSSAIPKASNQAKLSFEIETLIKENPRKYLVEAFRFIGLPTELLYSFISKIRDWIRNGPETTDMLWPPILELCKWIVKQPLEEEAENLTSRETDWGRVRSEIAHLFYEGLNDHQATVPYELRSEVWSVLEPLTKDPNPTPEEDADANRPHDLSINSVRGWAMRAAMKYALWVKRGLDKVAGEDGGTESTFAPMPEVRGLLENHLDPKVEPAAAIRSVYGDWYPWIVLLDEGWAKANKDRIFATDPDSSRLFEAAWNTYVVFCNPYDSVFPIIRDKYQFAVDKIGKTSEQPSYAMDPDYALVKHLVSFYWRGLIEYDDPLVQGMYKHAPVRLRGHVIDFIGESLRDAHNLTPEVIDRLKNWWRPRLCAMKDEPEKAERKELCGFGYWVVSGKLDDDWSLGQLEESLQLCGCVEPDHLVLKHLAGLSQQFPSKTLSCLSLMISDEQLVWSRHPETRTIIANARDCGDPQVRSEAIALIHRLGSLGFFKYRDLLPPKTDEGEDRT